MNYPIFVLSQEPPQINNFGMKELWYKQYSAPHKKTLLPPSFFSIEKVTKTIDHSLLESTTSAALELINDDDFETFPKIECCDDGVQDDECHRCSSSPTVSTTKRRGDPINKRRRSSSCEENKESKTNVIGADADAASCHHHHHHHYHGLVRSMCIRSRLSVLALPA